jgi:hypothetical protein
MRYRLIWINKVKNITNSGCTSLESVNVQYAGFRRWMVTATMYKVFWVALTAGDWGKAHGTHRQQTGMELAQWHRDQLIPMEVREISITTSTDYYVFVEDDP